MPAVDRFGDVVRAQLYSAGPGGGSGGGSGADRSTVVDPEGLVRLANSVVRDLHADAEEARGRLHALATGAGDLGPDEHAQRMSGVVAEALEVYLAWSREIERLLLDVQEGMVAAAREYRGADDASAAELSRRSADAFVDRVPVPVDADGDGRVDSVQDTGLDARDRHEEREAHRDDDRRGDADERGGGR